MEKGMFVKDITDKNPVHGIFCVNHAVEATTRKNTLYWALTLHDVTGDIDAKIWTPEQSGLSQLPGVDSYLSITKARGSWFKDTPQISIEQASLLSSDAVDWTWFFTELPKKPTELFGQLMALLEKELTFRPWKDFVDAVFGDERIRTCFLEAPGAASVHHAYRGGLLEHTLAVCRLVLFLADAYPALDRQTLLVGALFHDIGKIDEYSYVNAIDVTTPGRILGHMALGLALLEPFCQHSSVPPALLLHLKHLILSHHGQLEYGASVLPQTQEALALHYADNLDAKMAICEKHLAKTTLEHPWTEPINTLDRRRLFHVEGKDIYQQAKASVSQKGGADPWQFDLDGGEWDELDAPSGVDDVMLDQAFESTMAELSCKEQAAESDWQEASTDANTWKSARKDRPNRPQNEAHTDAFPTVLPAKDAIDEKSRDKQDKAQNSDVVNDPFLNEMFLDAEEQSDTQKAWDTDVSNQVIEEDNVGGASHEMANSPQSKDDVFESADCAAEGGENVPKKRRRGRPQKEASDKNGRDTKNGSLLDMLM
ncbi:MAG: HD domain-containing protein [Desulfovibrio sp.]|nr:HD domain-containing protein [Desulfovibrio sp.]